MRYFFSFPSASGQSKCTFTSAVKPVVYRFKYANRGAVKYRVRYTAGDICYRFGYPNEAGRGRWRFRCDFRGELYREEPVHSLMYQMKEAGSPYLLYAFMPSTCEVSLASLMYTLASGLRETNRETSGGAGFETLRILTAFAPSRWLLLSGENRDSIFTLCEFRAGYGNRWGSREFSLRNLTRRSIGTSPGNEHEHLANMLNRCADATSALLLLAPFRTKEAALAAPVLLNPAHGDKDAFHLMESKLSAGNREAHESRDFFAERTLLEALYVQLIAALARGSEENDAEVSGETAALRETLRELIDERGESKAGRQTKYEAGHENAGMMLMRILLREIYGEAVGTPLVKLPITALRDDITVRADRRRIKPARLPDAASMLSKHIFRNALKLMNISALDVIREKAADVESPEKQQTRQTETQAAGDVSELALSAEAAAALVTGDCSASAESEKSGDVEPYTELSPVEQAAFTLCGAMCTAEASLSGFVDMQNEHELTLWKRLWFVCAESPADKVILPCHDYPYADEPVEFEGFDDLVPENYNAVYPEAFWRRIGHHPIPNGAELGTREIPLAINIMVELVNILMLMWSRFYRAFWGWTGTQAVLGITAELYAWLTLEASRAEQDGKSSREHYDRCYRWLRWEAEKVALAARNDMQLRGNFYVEVLLKELISYMLDHHFDIMPIFKDIGKMDEWRRLFGSDLQRDIEWTLDKVKGIRHKLIIGKERKENV